MFSDSDPVLLRVRRIALSLPGAQERISHGRPNFFTTRTFCYYGGSKRGEAERVRHDTAILVKPDPDDEPAIRQDPRFWEPAYLWPAGWLGLVIDERTDWAEIAELIDASYRVTAPRTLVRELDARRT